MRRRHPPLICAIGAHDTNGADVTIGGVGAQRVRRRRYQLRQRSVQPR